MDAKPSESSTADSPAPPPKKRVPNFGIFLVVANACLLVPFCVTKGFGFNSWAASLGRCYVWWVLGFPTTFAGSIVPDLGEVNPYAILAVFIVFIVNYVVASYLLGQLLSWALRKVLDQHRDM
jgi:hypothetical protein